MSDKKYIEVNEFITKLSEAYHDNTYKEYMVFNDGISKAKMIAREMLAADVEEIKHGKWLFINGNCKEEIWMCDQCERCIRSERMEKDELIKRYPYCHCGAKMIHDEEFWCNKQQLDENHELICLAHLAEGRVLKCPYKDAIEREAAEYPCSDYEMNG